MEQTGLPEFWVVKLSRSRNRPYYYNTKTAESLWEPPQGTDLNLLKKYIATKFRMTESSSGNAPAGSSPAKIRVQHLLVKHNQSRRPSSWKEANITRSKEEAYALAKNFLQQLRSGAVTMSELASRESDCSSAKRGGDLGFFGRNEMQKPFEDAAFALNPNQFSDIVESSSGFHIILRTA
ncbi:peptidyl-prolyl cis-trans isomerase Pin1 [Schizosaccharomyces japonicus yFS275]|uniref:Peptidyl-prolyl cis-trans isomerase n=1 Tax=Schizosaccharomyces japonicus (strain yFS275 / FY16936) TaxID=402676 RepID=B6K0J5_SCHJY|nr:peptidyl-prolyl cis-trans isomerase Pin1 [Schizosaccharomyces japonicus yFS275]EEB07466.1 peptidyl-prolyl cis-trans isomerase Pin1 [Schizosaccharomyces japonicus yFS275]